MMSRFREIISIQKIIDATTDTQYDGLVDEEFINLINEISDENDKLKGIYQDIKNETRFTVNDVLDICDNKIDNVYEVNITHNNPQQICNLLNELNNEIIELHFLCQVYTNFCKSKGFVITDIINWYKTR